MFFLDAITRAMARYLFTARFINLPSTNHCIYGFIDSIFLSSITIIVSICATRDAQNVYEGPLSNEWFLINSGKRRVLLFDHFEMQPVKQDKGTFFSDIVVSIFKYAAVFLNRNTISMVATDGAFAFRDRKSVV